MKFGSRQMFSRKSALRSNWATLRATIIVLVAVTVPLPASAFGPRPNAPLSTEKLSRIDDFLNDQIARGQIPGAIVLIQRHGKPVYFKLFGKRDVDAGTDMTTDAIFPLHSLTKTVTNFAAMMLVDRGKEIKLDDPVRSTFPPLRGMKVGVERKDDAGRPCSISCRCAGPSRSRICCCIHRGSPMASMDERGWLKAAYDGIISAISTTPDSPSGSPRSPSPSSRAAWDYGHSIDVLGRVIEVASGQSLYQFEKSQLFDPLGMTTHQIL